MGNIIITPIPDGSYEVLYKNSKNDKGFCLIISNFPSYNAYMQSLSSWVRRWGRIGVVFVFYALLLAGLPSCGSTPHQRTHSAPLLPGMTKDVKGAKSLSEDPDAAPPPSKTGGDLGVSETIPLNEEFGEELEETPKQIESKDEVDEDKGATSDGEDDSEEDEGTSAAPFPTPKKHQIPFEFNKRVAEWISYFSQKDRERFQRFLDRAEPYREAVENILEENGVPSDLYYLGMIESGFVVQAKSHAKAVGVWQFMRPTGKLYGLGVDAYVDERKDPIRATEAAAKLMRDLYREFHSWYLAMAAYNAGLGRIRGAVKRGHSNDFWELVEKKVLPRETMDYVPKFLAARYIGENPDVFAFYINKIGIIL